MCQHCRWPCHLYVGALAYIVLNFLNPKVKYSTFGFRKCGLKAQWSTQPRASEATPWVSRVGTVAP